MGAGRALLVEDDEPIREAVDEILQDEGWTVVTAATLAEARAALAGGVFDVLLLDLMLEDGAGEEILEELERKGRRVPTVIMSASTRTQATAQRFGAETLHKPFEIETLLARIQGALERGKTR